MRTFSADARADAWLLAAEALSVANDRLYNVILEIKQPALATPTSRQIEARVDRFLAEHSSQPIHTVAETIFPASEYRLGGMAAVYRYPETVYPLIKNVQANTKGTYALRMTERKCSDGTTFRPLEYAITKLKKQLQKAGPLRAVYEFDLNMEALELKLYDPEIDHKNVRGGQCLSHISLKLGANRELYLTALFRYQYFIQKALGNFLGLARLQDCIARELGIPVGPLVSHATLAVLESTNFDAPWSAEVAKELIDDCRAIADGRDQKEAA
jgi:hypothetical protein